MKEITTADFAGEVLQAASPVLVDFYTTTCQPCRRMAPVLEEIARCRPTEIKIVKLNCEAEPAAAAQYGVRTVPTFLLFVKGRVVAQSIGERPREAFERWLDQAEAENGRREG